MKHLYALTTRLIFLFCIVCFISISLQAQTSETEPNNSFETATPISIRSVKTGSVSNVSDQYDYFVAVFPSDGTLKIFINGKNNGGNGYLFMYGYDKRKGSGQVFGRYISSSSVAAGANISDTITLYGRAADTSYFRLETSGNFSYSLSYDIVDLSENDNEPNTTFETATIINQAEEKKGHIGYTGNGTTDLYDYYATRLGSDGTLKIYVQGKNNSGSNGYLYMYGYDRRKASGQILGRYITGSNVVAGSFIYDTITVYGRASDSFYFRMESAGAFNYTISYNLSEISENDIEPNDLFENATAINANEEKKGHISYAKNGETDTYDYYRTILPVDGTLKIYIEGANTSGSNGYLYMYGFDKRKASGQVFGTYVSGSSNSYGSTITDSVVIYGVLADTFYFRVQSAGAYQYKIRYAVVQNSELDEEPNNTFEDALALRQGVIKNGQVGYTTGGVRDNYDYYKTLLPADGTMKIYIKGTNNSGNAGYLYMYGYDRRKASGQIYGNYISSTNVAAGATIYDTLTLYGRAADSFYYRMESAGAWSYSLSYDIIDTSEIDAEPNGSFEEALAVNPLEEKKGHISYVKNGVPDQYDYYRAVFATDGTLKIYTKGLNNSGGNSYLYLYGYDNRKGSGQVLGKYIFSSNVTAGTTVYDTTLIYGRAADTFYFRIESAGAFSYSLKYEINDISANDDEPNNTFETALPINPGETKEGHVNYARIGITDQYDYYKTVLPQDGTLRIYVSGTNNSGTNGYLYMYGYDRRKSSGQVMAKYIANNSGVAAGITIYDTINITCRAADTFYFRIESAGAFSYTLSYDITNTSPNDTEPNNSFEVTQVAKLDSIYNGHIGYLNNGGQDTDDYFKTLLPARGIVKIIVEGTNTSGSNGYLYLYGYDKRKGNGQIFANYINNSNIANGSTVRDTITLNCTNTDTFYLRWISAGCFRYSFKIEFSSLEPKADFYYTRVGNNFGFNKNANSNGTSFLWDLGNGTTTANSEPPITNYGPGFYQAKLIARNNKGGCLFTDTAIRSFTVKGIEKYTPQVGGPGNILFTVYGGGLDSNVVVKLTQGTRVYTDSATTVNRFGNIYSCIADLHDAPQGHYDVDIITADSTYHYTNGFKLEALKDYLRVEIVGRELIRTNTDNFYTLRVYNEGNTLTGVSKAYLLTAPNVEVTFLDSLIPVAKTQYVDPDTLSDVLSVTKAQGFPIDGNIRGYYVTGIPQGEFKDIRFNFRFQPGVNDMYAWSTGPINGSPDRPWLSDCWKARLKHAYNVVNFGLDVIPLVDCAWNSFKLALGTFSFFANGAAGSYSDGYDISTAYGALVKTGVKTAKNCSGELSLVTGPLGAGAVETIDISSDLLLNAPSVEESWYEWDAACGPQPKDKTKKKTDARTSFDPNAKTGPSGIGFNRYINGKDRLMSYAIHFENLPTASLPAQNVVVYDTLDKNVYDLNTFRVGNFGVGQKSYKFSPDVKEYVSDLNLSTTLAARVNMKLDTTTGILTTMVKTLDRSTGDTTTDPLAGFLPPNINASEGAGYITYSIQMKEGLSDGTQLKNHATIVFDNNAPIETATWQNTLDILPPASAISNVIQSGDSAAIITSSGSDATSGIEYYQLYASQNGGPYRRIANVGNTVTFSGSKGNTYNFYVIAVDSVGNIETKTASAEGTITFGAPLTINLGEITAINLGTRNRINWNTLDEAAGDYFKLERSNNGIDFTPFITLQANGFASSYQAFDEAPYQGRTYYRLRLYKPGGSFKLSKNVSALAVNSGTFMVQAYPNPITEKLTISISGLITEGASIDIVSAEGTVIKKIRNIKNTNEINMSNMSKGVLFIRYTDKDHSKIIKIIKN